MCVHVCVTSYVVLDCSRGCHLLLQGIANYEVDILASDVKAVVSALGHSRCTLVAHDWGGVVAWATAGMYGQELVEQLIVMGLPHVGVSSTNMSGKQYMRSLYIMTFQVCRLWTALHASTRLRCTCVLFFDCMQACMLLPPQKCPCVEETVLCSGELHWHRPSQCRPAHCVHLSCSCSL
jgi:hypothetical protein